MGPYDEGYNYSQRPYLDDDIGESQPRTVKIVDRRPAATERANFTGEYPEAPIRSVVRNAIRVGVNPYIALAVGMQENNLGRGDYSIRWGAHHVPKSLTNDTTWDGILSRYNDPQLAKERTDLKNAIQEASDNSQAAYQESIDAWKEASGEGSVNFRRLPNGKLETINPYVKAIEDESAYLSKRAEALRKQLNNRPEVLDEASYHFVSSLKDKLAYGQKISGAKASEERILQAYNGYGKVPSGTDPRKLVDAGKELPYGRRVKALKDYTISTNPYLQQIVAQEASIVRATQQQ